MEPYQHHINSELIDRYLNSRCTAAEKEQVQQWYNSFEPMPDPITFLSPAQQLELKNRMLERIKTNIIEISQSNDAIPFYKNWKYGLSAAAAIVLLVLGTVLWNNKVPKLEILQEQAAVSEEVHITNSTKSIQRQQLPDGSTVWLSPFSSVIYPSTFKGSTRELKLKGEAFFEVTKDEKHPFIIYSGDITTKVWGTSFRISAFENNSAEVSVLTGRVSVKISNQDKSEVMLLPDQKAIYVRSLGLLKKEEEKKASIVRIWKKTSMSFDNAPLSSVMEALNTEFNVHITTHDQQLQDYLLKADFTDQSLPDILEMMGKSLNVDYELINNEITLKRKPINH